VTPGTRQRCPACGAPLREEALLQGVDRFYGTPGAFEVRVCTACGSGRTFPLVPADELRRFYPEAYNAHTLPEQPPLRLLATLLSGWRHWHALRRHPLRILHGLPPGRLLDVGAGRGDLGLLLGRLGWQVTGLEPSAEACRQGRSRGLQLVEGTLSTADPAKLGEGYDAVVFQHSLEHVVEPKEDLARARELLRDEGLLLLLLPNFDSWERRSFGTAWLHLDLPRHRTHFTPAGLERLLERSGFEARRLTTSTTPEGLPMSLQYRLFGRRRVRRGFALYLMYGIFLALVPLSVVLDALKGGGDQLGASAVRPGPPTGPPKT
jgi:SAM-dependent methyltransferase